MVLVDGVLGDGRHSSEKLRIRMDVRISGRTSTIYTYLKESVHVFGFGGVSRSFKEVIQGGLQIGYRDLAKITQVEPYSVW